ncbi:hypothetical protein CCR75_004936 [Bremia lactucae]|uniref:Uncharacterized protein n=1 Tax=Bremia lactucae TaxID=4779 RepID=A0A976FIS8_BRELC|nr:hypothetical protein CCR75_004936 [Bremia lactucae]
MPLIRYFWTRFGDLLVPITMLDDLALDDWKGGSMKQFLKAGHQVLTLVNNKTEVAYSLHEMCHVENIANWVRTWSEQTRYLSLASTGRYNRNHSVFLDAKSIPKFLRWNVNLIALDSVDVAKMAAMVWSWAEDEPSTTAFNAMVFMDKNGRWVTSTTARPRYRACWSPVELSFWFIVSFDKPCPTGTSFRAPDDPYQNYLLHKELVVNKIVATSVVINAKLSAMPPQVTAVLGTAKTAP